MRLQPVPVNELDEALHWWGSQEPWSRLTSSSRLSALRRQFYEDALAAVGPNRTVKVCTYVFAGRGVDVEGSHALLARNARDRGWTVHRERFTDEATDGPLPAWPQFDLACRHARSGFVDGVLVHDRNAMPVSDESYEAYLRWLNCHHAFIAFLQPTFGGTPCVDR
ncbi:hypothetical protein [Streptomyces lavendulocolor]|uniref:hypothetical protein n=1 Tax=Streptomyces lavendulocolor TaxID=67316 RepID=UPI0033FB3C38